MTAVRQAVLLAGVAALVTVGCGVVEAEVGPRQEIRWPTGDGAVEIDIVDRVNEDGAIESAWAVDGHALLGQAYYPTEQGGWPAAHRHVGQYDALVAFSGSPCPWAPEIRVDDDGEVLRLRLRTFTDCGDAESFAPDRAVALRFAEGVDPAEITVDHTTVG